MMQGQTQDQTTLLFADIHPIDHIKKVIPEVIKCNRQATGF